jgi:hypothetical protein
LDDLEGVFPIYQQVFPVNRQVRGSRFNHIDQFCTRNRYFGFLKPHLQFEEFLHLSLVGEAFSLPFA